MKMFNKWIIGAWKIFYFVSKSKLLSASNDRKQIYERFSIDIQMCCASVVTKAEKNIFFLLKKFQDKSHQVSRMTGALKGS